MPCCCTAEQGCPVPRIEDGTIAELQRRDWPGNVRELHNALEHALVVAEDPAVLSALDLPPALGAGQYVLPMSEAALDLPEAIAPLSRDDIGKSLMKGERIRVGRLDAPAPHAVQDCMGGFMGDDILRQASDTHSTSSSAKRDLALKYPNSSAPLAGLWYALAWRSAWG